MSNFRTGMAGAAASASAAGDNIKGPHALAVEQAGAVGDALSALSSGPNVRMANGISNRNRQVMTWRLPNGTNVQMYINPEEFSVNESKQIEATRTKGGFVVQYWGDNLTELTLRGTTGSAGVAGINVLRDIYRAENRTFELVAATQLQELHDETAQLESSEAGNAIERISKAIRRRNFILRPSLASLALSVMLFYQGVQYRGYFKAFTMNESINKLGLFDYNISFTATEIRGKRDNFMPWHREPLADDLSGQLLNATGNAIRSAIGLQQQAPQQFHPENAPYTFGGSSLLSQAGVDASGAISSSSIRSGLLI